MGQPRGVLPRLPGLVVLGHLDGDTADILAALEEGTRAILTLD
jgi:hypothetical protein